MDMVSLSAVSKGNYVIWISILLIKKLVINYHLFKELFKEYASFSGSYAHGKFFESLPILFKAYTTKLSSIIRALIKANSSAILHNCWKYSITDLFSMSLWSFSIRLIMQEWDLLAYIYLVLGQAALQVGHVAKKGTTVSLTNEMMLCKRS